MFRACYCFRLLCFLFFFRGDLNLICLGYCQSNLAQPGTLHQSCPVLLNARLTVFCTKCKNKFLRWLINYIYKQCWNAVPQAVAQFLFACTVWALVLIFCSLSIKQNCCATLDDVVSPHSATTIGSLEMWWENLSLGDAQQKRTSLCCWLEMVERISISLILTSVSISLILTGKSKLCILPET